MDILLGGGIPSVALGRGLMSSRFPLPFDGRLHIFEMTFGFLKKWRQKGSRKIDEMSSSEYGLDRGLLLELALNGCRALSPQAEEHKQWS